MTNDQKRKIKMLALDAMASHSELAARFVLGSDEFIPMRQNDHYLKLVEELENGD